MSDFVIERGQDSLGVLGTVVAKHLLLRVIGEGGMGRVYVGEHEILKCRRAIKICKVSGARLRNERAVNEARMMAQLNHPGICKLYDVEWGPPDGTSPVMVMELLQGHSFFAETAKGAIPWQRSVEVAIDVLDALEAAHRQGIIHRDIKPENVFIAREPDGRFITKVMDFGIAKLVAVAVTKTGTQMGTPHYMSPEQAANAKSVDARADLYSVGAMLYRCVTGSYLFPRETAAEIFAGHLNEQPRAVRSLAPDVPEELAQTIHCALAKKKEQRFASAAQMRDALRRCLAPALSPLAGNVHAVPTLQRARRRPRLRSVALLAAGTMLTTGLAVVAYLALSKPTHSEILVPAITAPSAAAIKPSADSPAVKIEPIAAPKPAPVMKASRKKKSSVIPDGAAKKQQGQKQLDNGTIEVFN